MSQHDLDDLENADMHMHTNDKNRTIVVAGLRNVYLLHSHIVEHYKANALGGILAFYVHAEHKNIA